MRRWIKVRVGTEGFDIGDIILIWPLLLRLLMEYHCVQYIMREAELIQDVVLKGVVLAIKQETSRLSGATVN